MWMSVAVAVADGCYERRFRKTQEGGGHSELSNKVLLRMIYLLLLFQSSINSMFVLNRLHVWYYIVVFSTFCRVLVLVLPVPYAVS